jgi:hypothetical protein
MAPITYWLMRMLIVSDIGTIGRNADVLLNAYKDISLGSKHWKS